jgi:hypothetical protein
MSQELNEQILPDDYPVNWDYIYVVDGTPRRSDIRGTVADLKRDLHAQEIKNCDLFNRGLM